jgi:hypothetical protein
MGVHRLLLPAVCLPGVALVLMSGCAACKCAPGKVPVPKAMREGETPIAAARPPTTTAPAEVPAKPSEEVPPAAPDLAALTRMAQSDHNALLEYCLRYYNTHYHDYTCLFIKQERLQDTLGPAQTIEAKFLQQPFGVVLHWVENAPSGDLAIYVEGENDGKMIVHPNGLPGFLAQCLRVDPEGKEAEEQSLYPITHFGFQREIETFLETNRQAMARGDFKSGGGEKGVVEETGRTALIMERHLPDKEGYPAELTKVYIDTEYLVPVKAEGYDGEGQLKFKYLYRDIRFNVGLSLDDFTPQANGLTCTP